MSLSESTITTVKATIPVLRAHAVDITSRMYENLFEKYPHTRSLFGAAPEDQPNILAAAITAYAVNIDNLDSLSEAVSRMASAHVRTNVRPEHYPMVARRPAQRHGRRSRRGGHTRDLERMGGGLLLPRRDPHRRRAGALCAKQYRLSRGGARRLLSTQRTSSAAQATAGVFPACATDHASPKTADDSVPVRLSC